MEERKIRGKFEPFAVLICFFLLTVLFMMIQFKLEEIFHFELPQPANQGLLAFWWALLVFFFLIYYKRRNIDIFSWLKLDIRLLLMGFFLPIIIDLITYLGPFILTKEAPPHFHFQCRSWINFLLKISFVAIISPIIEENFFRGILLRLFIENYSLPSAIILNGFLFAILHIGLDGGTLILFIAAFIARLFHGILLSAVTYKTKNLSFAIGFHISNNFLALLSQ